jgi:hypothetical protein
MVAQRRSAAGRILAKLVTATPQTPYAFSLSRSSAAHSRGITMKRSLPLLSTVACSAAMAIPLLIAAPAQAATACADLAKLALPQTKITVAERVAAGDFKAPGVQQPLKVPAMCRVAGTVEPAINFEVWLP